MLGAFAVLTSVSLWSTATQAAQVDAADLTYLQQTAAANGVVRVMIGLDVNAGLDQLSSNRAGVEAATDARASAIRAELGDSAWSTGYWNGGTGQIGLYVNEQGLKILQKSRNARMFEADRTSSFRFKVFNPDRRLEAIEEQISKTGTAEVDITFNLQHLDYEIGKDGQAQHRISEAASIELRERMGAFLQSIGTRLSPDAPQLSAKVEQARLLAAEAARAIAAGKAVALADPGFGLSPRQRMRLTREGFYALRENPEVLGMMPVGWVGQRKQIIDEDLLEIARKNGTARVILTASGFDAFSVRPHEMSKSASQAQDRAIRNVFDELSAQAGDGMKNIQLSPNSVAADMSEAAIARLIDSKDARIFAMQYNRGGAKPQLETTTPYINMPAAWNLGYRAAGQTIVIYDTGVLKTHDMMQRRLGSGLVGTKVTSEDCFGTDLPPYVSVCPNKNASGDSPPGLIGSGAPPPQAICPATAPVCSHGTHAAGIAAGSPVLVPGIGTRSGVAPDASIAAVQVFSWNGTTSKAFNEDIQRGLQELVNRRIGSNAYVANLSFAEGGTYTRASCPSILGVSTVVSQLIAAGIPVVAAAGNDGYNGIPRGGSKPQTLSWPACIPNVIAVSNLQLLNVFGSSVQLASESNILPDSFDNPIFLAPGARYNPPPQTFGVQSAVSSGNNQYLPLNGTSFAAPHVSGFIAAYKAAVPAASVADVIAWIRNTASRPFVLTLPNGTQQTYRSIRAPL